jgi:hypothetical protein
MQRNPLGFLMLLAVTLWVAFTVVRAFRTGEIYSRGMYAYRRDEKPFMYWMVFLAHVAIVVGFTYALMTLG